MGWENGASVSRDDFIKLIYLISEMGDRMFNREEIYQWLVYWKQMEIWIAISTLGGPNNF